MHDEGIPPGLRGSLELHFERLHIEGWVSYVVVKRFAEGDEGEGWHGDLAGSAVSEKDVPSWRAIAREVGGVCERWLEWFLL